MSTALNQVVEFLIAIGLPVVRCERTGGFVPDVRIVNGALHVTDQATAPNVLHEAGHLAIIPARYRPLMDDDIEAGIERMMEAIDWSDPDAPECRMATQCGETEATAWAWAAGIHLGLEHTDIIADEDYGRQGAGVRWRLEHDAYLGINGLCHAGFCGRGELGRKRGLPLYPALSYWLQQGAA